MNRIWLSIDFDYFCREEPVWDWGHRESLLFRDVLWGHRVMGFASNGVDLRKEVDPKVFARPTPETFWDEIEKKGLDLSKTWRIIVADSHTYAAIMFASYWFGNVPINARTLINFDAHHDLGYSKENIARAEETHIDCGNWLYFVMKQWKHLKSHNIYPPWLGMQEWEQCFIDGGSIGPYFDISKGCKEISKRATASVWDEDVPQGPVDWIFICRSGSWVPPWLDSQFISFVKEIAKRTGTEVEFPFMDDESCNPMVPRDIDVEGIIKQATQIKSLLKDKDMDKDMYNKFMQIKNQEGA